ncbi:phosphoadenosine phosphosulfate reductase family protein [Fusicatenibacter saccharivorans]|uniref:phosphoadenosine phosphosulfate reductase domain-containing protein n=1 Tax=Fusicatenibacter saccharivorans TaxID=1150298 RepID=UPI0032C0A8E2
MYSYDWDPSTGGYILNSTPLKFSKEPRPVYYKELDMLGFDKYWNYEKNDAYPYMWAEANSYWYRGRKVAQTKGGSLYSPPKITILQEAEPQGKMLKMVDIPAMVKKNASFMEGFVQETIKKVYNTYVEYQRKADVFYVAFSGGKDSVVTLDIVQRALPHNAFKVLFGDTGMEFPDTYRTVDLIEKWCKTLGVEFIRAKSEFSPEYTWRRFGPPATVTRWCCSVHKTAPQIIALRENTGKHNFTGMAFIGVRGSESLSRSEYDYVSLGEKHKGQYSCNPILEWNSAELFYYIYANDLILNEAYKKGNRRAGCLVCPRAAERNEYMSRECYPEAFDTYANIIRELYKQHLSDQNILEDFIANGGWKARKNGRDLSLSVGYEEKSTKTENVIEVHNPKVDWKVWIRTIGVLLNDGSPYRMLFRNEEFTFTINPIKDGYEIHYDKDYSKSNPLFVKLFKNVFRKSACCIGCRECEADCHNGCISMKNGKVTISEKCLHCAQCHKVEKGCLIYKSLEMPKGGLLMSANKSLNCYSHHAPKADWFKQYFEYKNEFDQKHSLGSQMYSFFKRFLRDSELLDEGGFSTTAQVVDKLGLDEPAAWGIMLTNLAYTPQINWFIKRISMGENYSKEYTLSLLVQDGAKESWVNDIWSSFGRFVELPFNEVGMGHAYKEKNRVSSITRSPWEYPEPLVILYSLYKFAEACDGYYQFTLTRLLNHDIDSDGVSPTEIFGIDRSSMEKILNGLSVNYPEFINCSFTIDLDNISLRSDKKSADVLELF